MTPSSENALAKETVINCIEASIIKAVATRHFIDFDKLGEWSEKKIEEKSMQLRENIVPTSYNTLIGKNNLVVFIADEWIEASFIDEITEQEVQQRLEERC